MEIYKRQTLDHWMEMKLKFPTGSNHNKKNKNDVQQESPDSDQGTDFLDQKTSGPSECLEGANPPEAYPGCLLPEEVGQTHYTLTALEQFDLQTVG